FEDVAAANAESKVQLVIAGERGWLSDGVFDLLRNSPARGHIVLTGYLGDAELCALYSSCRAFVYPSIHEGFGLPPVEAMSCGAPVVASNTSAVAEVTAGAARLVDPTNKYELGQALVEVLREEGLRSELIAAGQTRASQFSWNRSAALTLEVYREAARRIKNSRRE